MKPEKKPFIVEIKNRRRLPRQEHSIWGKIDLKAAGNQVAGQVSDDSETALPVRHSEAPAQPKTTDISA